MLVRANNKSLHNLTLIAVGIMAYVLADIIHEAIGHGVTSVVLGNKVKLLTSVYFRSDPHSFITDAFGPVLNLATGLITWILLGQITISNFYLRLLCVVTMAFNFFWFSWMCIYGGFTNKGDLAFFMPGQTELFIWRLFLILFGLFTYFFFFRLIKRRTDFKGRLAMTNSRNLFLLPYLSAAITALIAISFYQPLSFNNYYEAFVFPMFLPLLLLPTQIEKTNNDEATDLFSGQKTLLVIAFFVFVVFILTLRRGMKF